ncbi:hypothetical protein EI94DRAFT_1760534 [Lactarius quietus]|nr:hypothetical protein EI94DRAFT_1760534 [Lactarius quietus]
MRPRERALVHRLKEIVDFVKGLGRDVAVIENGDYSVMIATAAEANPTVFSPHPLTNLEDTFILPYLRLCKYLDNHWASTKFCISQFKGRKSANKALRSAVIKAKSYADLDALVKDWAGSDEFAAIKAAIDARATAPPILLPASDGDTTSSLPPVSQLPPKSYEEIVSTPPGWRGNPDPAVIHDAPLLPTNERRIPPEPAPAPNAPLPVP